jgi:hypothetical protein
MSAGPNDREIKTAKEERKEQERRMAASGKGKRNGGSAVLGRFP